MLTIADYKNWALNDQRSAVALNDGGNALVTENVRLGGGLARAIFRGAHDAFKVAARIAVLSNLIGKVPCWNCKSGKDRTGQMDVECKFLSTLIARGETIPEPGARLTDAQKRLFRSIALEGGNFEVQKMNTAIAGFKTGSVKSVTERLGGSEYRRFHRGGSDHVNV